MVNKFKPIHIQIKSNIGYKIATKILDLYNIYIAFMTKNHYNYEIHEQIQQMQIMKRA